MDNKNKKYSTVNLTDTFLNNDCLDLLEKGLTFAPTPSKVPIKNLVIEKYRLIRQVKLKTFFNTPLHRDLQLKSRYYVPSNWEPEANILDPGDSKTIDNIHFNLDHQLEKFNNESRPGFINNPAPDNLSKNERIELKKLQKNETVIIKPADKGGATVLMETKNYILEAERQLNDPKYYYPLSESYADCNSLEIKKCLKEMKELKFINHKEYEYMLPKKYNERSFYLLPKIHKPPEKWTIPHRMPQGRPIVSDVGSETYEISKYIDYFINPLSQNHPAYIKNSFDFLHKLKSKNLDLKNRDFFLVTGDVASLYTNMHINRSLQKVEEIFQRNPDPTRSDPHILKLLKIALRGNDFYFNNKYYLQIMGTAMGKRFAPALANIYLLDFDRAAMEDFHIKPECFFRFLDDIFFIFFGTEEDLKNYETFLNSLIPDIKIELDFSRKKVNFLDLTIFIEEGELKHTVFHKPTDTHQLLHKKSYHPAHTFKGILKSQFIRFKRLCCDQKNYTKACNTLFKFLKNRGYGIQEMKSCAKKIWADPQYGPEITRPAPVSAQPAESRIDPAPGNDQGSHEEVFPIIGQFHEFNKTLLSTNREILSNNNKLKRFKFVSAYKANPTLKKILTRSRFPPKRTN